MGYRKASVGKHALEGIAPRSSQPIVKPLVPATSLSFRVEYELITHRQDNGGLSFCFTESIEGGADSVCSIKSGPTNLPNNSLFNLQNTWLASS